MAEGSVPGPSAHAAGEARGAAAAPRASGTVPDTDGDDGEANATASVCAGRRNFWQDRQPGGNKASSLSLHGSRTETALLNCGGDVRACRFRASATKWTAAAAAARRAKRLLDCCQADYAGMQVKHTMEGACERKGREAQRAGMGGGSGRAFATRLHTRAAPAPHAGPCRPDLQLHGIIC